MLGGVHDNGAPARPAEGQSTTRRLTAGSAALAVALAIALVVGVLVDLSIWIAADQHLLDITRESLQIATGALFFGAGLLHLSVWRVDRDETRGRVGVALVTCGFVAPWITGFGDLIHTERTAAVLSPVTSGFVGVLAMALGSSAVTRIPGRSSHPVFAIWSVSLLVPLMLVAPFFLRPGTSPIADPSTGRHLSLEVAVACLWLSAAALVARHVRRTGCSVPGVGPAVLAAMGTVWLLRAGAVIDVQPWSVAAAVLLAAIGLVVLGQAAVDFTESAEAGDERTTAAEEALATVAEAFSTLDAERHNMRHDARNVVLALSAASQTLLDHGDNLDAEVRNRLRRAIVEEVSHLGQLISPAPAKGVIAFEPGEVVSNVVEIERFNGLDVALTIEPCAAWGRPEELARVVRNLLVNVRQHAGSSRVRAELRTVGSHVQLLVEDDGPGIPEVMRHEVFGRGVRGVASVGTGLGLHVSRALMWGMGGTLELANTTSGACFVLNLPLADMRAPRVPSVRVPLPQSQRVYA